MNDFVIEARGVRKTFRMLAEQKTSLREHFSSFMRRVEKRELVALDDISFQLRKGEFLGIIGANGSGKTTLMRVLAGIYAPDRGDVKTSGKTAAILELGIGFNGELSARDNIVVNGTLMGVSRSHLKNHIDEILHYAGLSEFEYMKIKNFSSGMVGRLAFAVITQVYADTYLLDEVMAVGDHEFREKCMAAIEGLKDSGRTIVLATHDTEFLKKHFKRCILLDHGRIVVDGTPEECEAKYLGL